MNLSQIFHLAVFGIVLIAIAKKLPHFAIKRPVTYGMIISLIFLVGIAATVNLPVELMPDISYGNVTIFIDVRGGMPPPDVERLVTKPVEEAMSTVSKMKRTSSISKKNRSVVTVEFDPGTNMSLATMEVRENFLKVKSKLPKEIERPVIAHYEESDAPIVIAAFTSSSKTPEELRKFVEEKLKEKLMRTNGVANVELGGGRERKIIVNIDKNRLAATGIPIKKIVSVLEQNNLNMQVGQISGSSLNLGIRTVGAFTSVREIEDIGISVTQGGGIVRLKDVASVKDSYMEAETYSRLNSKSAVTLYIQKESLTNTVKVAERVKNILNDFKSKLGKDTQLLIVSDQSSAILNAINSVQMTLLYGVALVILILSLFLSKTRISKVIAGSLFSLLLLNLLITYALRIPLESSKWFVAAVVLGLIITAFFWRKDILPSFVVAFSIPVSVLMALTFMYLEKYSLNVISLSGLVLGIGLLVDNSIVVLENYDRLSYRMKGVNVQDIVEKAAAEMVSPMVGGTLTTVVVFLPFFMLQKQTQMLYSGIAFTVMASLLSSLFSALSLVPGLATRFTFRSHLRAIKTKIIINVEKYVKRLGAYIEVYKKKMSVRLKILTEKKPDVKVIVLAGFLAIAVLSLIFWKFLNISFDAGVYISLVFLVLFLGLLMLSRYSVALEFCLEHRKYVLGIIGVLFVCAALIFTFKLPKDFMAASEQSEFTIFIELASGVKLDISNDVVKEVESKIQSMADIKSSIKNISSKIEGWSSKIYVTLVPQSERRDSTQEIIDKLRSRLKHIGEKYDTFIYFSEPQSGKEIFAEIYGNNYETLSKIAMQLASYMGKVKEFSDVKVRYRPGQPEASVMLDPMRVASFGFDNKEVAETMHAQMRGLRATSFYDKAEEVETIVRISPDQVKTLEDLKNLYFVTPYGFQVLTQQMAVLRFGLSPSEIWHRNKTRMIQVSANLGSASLSRAAEICKGIFSKIPFPEEYYAEIGGDYEDMVQANRNFMQAMAVTILLIFVVMACLFESTSRPFIIMITVLLSAIGSVTALSLSKSTVTLGVSIGMLMLSGIVVNNGIMLIDRINLIKSRDSRRDIRSIIIEASSQRKRPIFMTTITTVLGLLPMALDRSESATLWSPLAITVIGGLLTSTILTLFVVPCFYLLFEDIRAFVSEKSVLLKGKLGFAGKPD